MSCVGAVATIFLLVLVGSAVPNVTGSPQIDIIRNIENSEEWFNEQITEKLFFDTHSRSLLNLLKQLILFFIQVVLKLINIVNQLIGLVALIEYLIGLILVLINAVVTLINTILDLFNPRVNLT